MIDFDSCSLKKSVPLLLALLVIAQLDLASAFGWPLPLLTALHLTQLSEDTMKGMAAGLGCILDVLAVFQLLRIVARRALADDRANLG